MGKLKNNLKEILLLLLIFLIIGGFCYIRYYFYKNKKAELSKYSKELTSQSIDEINNTKSSLWSRIKSSAENVVNIDKLKSDNNKISEKDNENSHIVSDTENDTNTLIHLDVSSEYDSFIFDDSLFMYQGEQNGKKVQALLNRMIETATDDFYSNPKLTIKNFGNSDLTILDDNDYVSNIEKIRNRISENETYNVTFGYNKLKTNTNEVIIEKK